MYLLCHGYLVMLIIAMVLSSFLIPLSTLYLMSFLHLLNLR